MADTEIIIDTTASKDVMAGPRELAATTIARTR